uniref:JAB domain-containing protein n=1 Tax=viral metagenome TaxID=1070528 RepID=A0A6C0JPL3_9ZZZZ
MEDGLLQSIKQDIGVFSKEMKSSIPNKENKPPITPIRANVNKKPSPGGPSLAPPGSTKSVEKSKSLPTRTIIDTKLEEIISKCINNTFNKNKFIEIFTNHFLNCKEIKKVKQPVTNKKVLESYFTELFSYSKNVLDRVSQYETYTQKFEEYKRNPIIFTLLNGTRQDIINITPNGLDVQILPITRNDIPLQKLKEYNKKIELDIVSVDVEEPVITTPFEQSIYDYIEQYIGKPEAFISLKKFDILNHIANMDTGVLISGDGGAIETVINTTPGGTPAPGTKLKPGGNPPIVSSGDNATKIGNVDGIEIYNVKFPEQISQSPLKLMITDDTSQPKTTQATVKKGVDDDAKKPDILPTLSIPQNFNLVGRNQNKFYIYITERDYSRIKYFTEKYPALETGGDLWGYTNLQDTNKLKKYDTVITTVTGPGKKCTRSDVTFNQDGEYLQYVHIQLQGDPKNSILNHIGDWHSHHTIDMPYPSNGDTRTIRRAMKTYNRKTFPCFITTITNGKSTIHPFLYVKTSDAGTSDMIGVTIYNAELRIINNGYFQDRYATLKLFKGSEDDNPKKPELVNPNLPNPTSIGIVTTI